MKKEIHGFFQQQNFEEGNMEVQLEGIKLSSIDEEDNDLLTTMFSKEDIKAAIGIAMLLELFMNSMQMVDCLEEQMRHSWLLFRKEIIHKA